MAKFHQPVLLKEIINYLTPKQGEQYIDATVGGGGHAEAILKHGTDILGLDTDPEAIKAARGCLSSACPVSRSGQSTSRDLDTPWQLAQVNFVHLKETAEKYGFNQVAGILFDLGVSSHQLKTASRGFSFNQDGPLDMRMGPEFAVTAADLVNGLGQKELKQLFIKLGDESGAGWIARAIVEARKRKPITSTGQLAQIVVQAKKGGSGKIHPATKVFQALRIAVNDELNSLKEVLPQAWELLKPKGRLLVISFHSGEDRIVKNFFRDKEKERKGRILTKKPIQPTDQEIKENPRSRSAKLRVIEKK